MQIHIVKPGETLVDISNQYGFPVQELILSNEIPNPDDLVIGQTIVIPIYGSYYYLQPGDSLDTVSKKFNIPLEDLLRINGIINPNNIPVGYRIYIPQRERKQLDIGSYIDIMYITDHTETIDKVAEDLTSLSIFSYTANRDGTLTKIDDQDEINTAYNSRVKPIMVLTNIEDGAFSKDLASYIFSNDEIADKLIDEAINIMDEKGYLGLDFDFEYLGKENKEGYVKFLKKAQKKLHEKGYTISVALAPKISDDQKGILYEGHDYEAIGKIVDNAYIMTYEWGWSGGPPLPVAPLNKVAEVMDYAVSKIPKEKILMGVPLYGYDWTLPFVEGESWAKSIDPQKAIMIAKKYGSNIEYDIESESPFFEYIDEEGKEHIVWFEDARSIQAKFDYVRNLGIDGLYYWVLGNEFPQNWLLIRENFIVEKKEYKN